MGLIPKTVLTPAKWAFKKVLYSTLMTFPAKEPVTIKCVYCPEMCRFACPTAVASGSDTVTPMNKMGFLYKEDKWPGRVTGGQELWPIYDCTGCGRCTEYCVYEQPVMETLFEARRKFSWEKARGVAGALTDAEDPVGDLADELGDEANARRRASAFQAGAGVVEVEEPRQAYFLGFAGRSAALSWANRFDAPRIVAALTDALPQGAWLLHESPWFTRHLGRAEIAQSYVTQLREHGARLELPFHHGQDCIDCGGEGAYHRLFADQAATMAREWWERDRHRAQGILCMSKRCAEHFHRVLPGVPVLSIAEILRGTA